MTLTSLTNRPIEEQSLANPTPANTGSNNCRILNHTPPLYPLERAKAQPAPGMSLTLIAIYSEASALHQALVQEISS